MRARWIGGLLVGCMALTLSACGEDEIDEAAWKATVEKMPGVDWSQARDATLELCEDPPDWDGYVRLALEGERPGRTLAWVQTSLTYACPEEADKLGAAVYRSAH